ncbi:MAG: SHOCT domain-containing protein [Actinomycetota bacterium]|nr:SHOCT domain-containing protein [Actinomycetota bacterium]
MPDIGFMEAPFVGLIALGQIVFWALVVIVVVRLIQDRNEGPRSPSALSLLEARYARGEIPREEFIERRAVLRGDTHPPSAS